MMDRISFLAILTGVILAFSSLSLAPARPAEAHPLNSTLECVNAKPPEPTTRLKCTATDPDGIRSIRVFNAGETESEQHISFGCAKTAKFSIDPAGVESHVIKIKDCQDPDRQTDWWQVEFDSTIRWGPQSSRQDMDKYFCGIPKSEYNIIDGTGGPDNLVGTPRNDLVRGYGGNDVMTGEGGNDCMDGGSGRDTIQGDGGSDTIFGGWDNDRINGGSGNDRIFGQAGGDILKGGWGNDLIRGGPGNDALDGGPGFDGADGGSGTDSCTNAEKETNCES